jgi:hypothetical protein
MLASLLYLLLHRLLSLVSPSDRSDQVAQLEILVLRHQLEVLRRQVKRPVYRHRDRALLAAASRILPRERWGTFLVRPETLLRWHRSLVARKWTRPHRPPGRPAIDPEVRTLILRMARENPRWGYLRIKGELGKLGLRVSATSIATLLRREGVGPAPRRGPTWHQFLKAQAAGIRAPNANAFAERWIETLRAECLDWLLILGPRHLDRVLRTYVQHYNGERPHRGLELRVPDRLAPIEEAQSAPAIERRDLLGGLVHEYRRAA